MSQTTTRFRTRAIAPSRLEAFRRAGVDDDGNHLERARLAEGGEPLRCCLRLAPSGDEIRLVSYRPFGHIRGPYAEVGPVFVHVEECPGPVADGDYPEDFRARQQVFRCYDADGKIVGGRASQPGEPPEAVLAELFADPGVALVHTRNIVYGCFMLEVLRSEPVTAH